MTFFKTFTNGSFGEQLRLMMTIPEFTALASVEQDAEYHPEGNVMLHTIEVAKVMTELLEAQDIPLGDWVRATNLLAAWFHDFGKIVSEVNIKGRISSIGHADRSEKIVREMLPKLDVPQMVVDAVAGLCREHMNYAPSEKAIIKLHGRLSNDGADVETFLRLKIADRWGRPPIERSFNENVIKTVKAWQNWILDSSDVFQTAARLLPVAKGETIVLESE